MKVAFLFLVALSTLALADKAPEQSARTVRILRRPRFGRQQRPFRLVRFQSPRQGREYDLAPPQGNVQFIQVETIDDPVNSPVVQEPTLFLAPEAQGPSLRNTYVVPDNRQQESQPASIAYLVDDASAPVVTEVREAPQQYLVPEETEVRQVEEETATGYGAPQEEVRAESEAESAQAPITGYLVDYEYEYNDVDDQAATVVSEVRASNGYGAPAETEETRAEESEEAATGYVVAEETAPVVTEVRQSEYANGRATQQVAAASSRVQQKTSSASSASRTVTREEPIAILRSSHNAIGTLGFERTFDYSFEAENGIKQDAQGELRTIDDAEVMVMSGSYEYIGDDGQTYVVDWYADETGYHPSAPHLPKSVEIEDPEHAALIEAQVRFAAEEDARERQAAESAPVSSFREAPSSSNYGAPTESRAQASQQESVVAPLPTYNYQGYKYYL